MIHLAQVLLDGIANGAIYASLALALVLIYRAANFVNFAQGEMAMIATYLSWQLMDWGAPWPAAAALALVISFGLGGAIQMSLVRPLEGVSSFGVVVVTIGLLLALNALAVYIWGSLIKSVPSLFPGGFISLGDVKMSWANVGILGVLAVEVIALWAMFRFTRFGLAMRASAESAEAAALSGVRVTRTAMAGWGLAAVLGTLAGLLIAPQVFLEPNFMFGVLIYAFAAAVLGGVDSPLGAVLGGLVLGVSENVAAVYIDVVGSDLKILVPLALIVSVLLVRPQGLFGSKVVARV